MTYFRLELEDRAATVARISDSLSFRAPGDVLADVAAGFRAYASKFREGAPEAVHAEQVADSLERMARNEEGQP